MPQPTTTVTSPKSRGVVPRVNSPQPRVTGHNAQSRVTLPPCETDRSSGRSNPPKEINFHSQTPVVRGKVFPPLAEAVPAVAAAALHARSAAAARAPATPANLISRRIRRNCGHLRHPLGAADHGNTTLGSNAHTISACGRNPSALHYPVHPPSNHHIQAPSPLAQASVRSPLTLQKERTRKLQVHMGLAASTTARLFPR